MVNNLMRVSSGIKIERCTYDIIILLYYTNRGVLLIVVVISKLFS